jgi:ribonuclease HI
MATGFIARELYSRDVLYMAHHDLGYGTSNQAEYMAILHACEYARTINKTPLPGDLCALRVLTDSQLVFRQLQGTYAVKDGKLRELHRRVKRQLQENKAVLVWHRRDENDGPLADKLASYRWKEVESENRVRPVGVGSGYGRSTSEAAGTDVGTGQGRACGDVEDRG